MNGHELGNDVSRKGSADSRTRLCKGVENGKSKGNERSKGNFRMAEVWAVRGVDPDYRKKALENLFGSGTSGFIIQIFRQSLYQ